MAPPEPAATAKRRRVLLAVLFSGVLMSALDIAIVGPALPALRDHWAVDRRALSWVFTIYVLANLVGVPLWSKLSDRAGRRDVYVLDVVLFVLGSMIVALAGRFDVLLLGRAVQGLAAGGIFPVASAVIGDTFPIERRGRTLGLIGAVFGVAFLLGPLLGAAILAVASWRWLFLINIPIGAVVAIAAWRVLPGRPAERPRSFDLLGLAALTTALVSLAVGVSSLDVEAGVLAITAPYVLGPLLLGMVASIAFVNIERRAADPILDMKLLARPLVSTVLLLALGAGLGEATVIFVPDLLVERFGISESGAALRLLPIVLAMAIGAPLAGRAVDAVGPRKVIATGVILLAAGLIAVPWATVSMVRLYMVGIAVGLGLAVLLGAPLRFVILAETAAHNRAAGQGALSLATQIGQIMGGAIVGGVAASAGGGVAGYETAFVLIGLLIGAAATSLIVLKVP